MYDIEGRRRLLLRGPASHKTPGQTTERGNSAGKCTEARAAEPTGRADEDPDFGSLSVDPRRICDMWDQHGNR